MTTFTVTRNNTQIVSFVRAEDATSAILVHDLACLAGNTFFGEEFHARIANWDEVQRRSNMPILVLDMFVVELTSSEDFTDVGNDATFRVRLSRYGDGLNVLASAKNKREATLVARLHALSCVHLRNRQSIAIGEATVESATFDEVNFAKAVVGDSGRTALYSRKNFAVTRA